MAISYGLCVSLVTTIKGRRANLKLAVAQVFMARLLAEPLQNCQHCGDNPSTVKLPLAFARLGLQDLAEGGRMLSMQHLLAEHARQLGPY